MKRNKKKKIQNKQMSEKVTAGQFFTMQINVIKELIDKHKKDTILILVLSCSLIFTNLLNLKFLEYVTNSVSRYIKKETITPFKNIVLVTSLFLLAILISKIIEWIYDRVNNRFIEKVKYDVETKIIHKLSSISYEPFENNQFHEKINMAKQAGNKYSDAIYGVSTIFKIIVSLIVYGVLLSKIHWIYSVVILGSMLINIVISGKVTDKQLDYWRTHVSPDSRKRCYFTGILKNRVNHQNIQTDRLFPYFGQKYHFYNKKNMFDYTKLNMLSFISEIATSSIFVLVFVATVVYIGAKVVNGDVQIGYFTMITAMLLELFQILKSFSMFMLNGNYYIKILAGYYEVMNLEQKYSKGNRDNRLNSNFEIKIDHLKFKYPQCESYALKGINCKFKSGEKIAIVGHNGSGKTTLMSILLGLFDNYEGEITIAGNRDISIIHNNITAILQDFVQYQMTIKENVEIGNGGKLLEEKYIKQALEEVCLSEMINEKQDGLYTQLGQLEKGVELSKGQWQRLAISRLLANKEAKIWVLDEPTAYLAPLSEIEMYNLIFSLAGNRLVFFISHRLGFAKNADRIIVIDDGRIIEQGTHEELMGKYNGLYRKMFESQKVWYE